MATKVGNQNKKPEPPTNSKITGEGGILAALLDRHSLYCPTKRHRNSRDIQCIYATMVILLRNNPDYPPMRAEKLWPATDWDTIWLNLHATPAAEDVKMDWYKVIHDIHLTKDRLHKIHISTTDQCNLCDVPDTLTHRLIECGDRKQMWEWTQGRISVILRISAKHMLHEWTMRPTIEIWPLP
jgi:hypothetical protein